jgi:arylsulfatase A-like enzyme/tetratricopeptide (TPR) repeat protein
MKKNVLLYALAAIAVGAAVLFLFVLRPGKPAGPGIQGRWAKVGVDKPNVIIVTMDTTRADHLACYGYPGVRTPTLDALAGRGVLFEQCAAASPLTLPSHATIMTGMYPTYHGVRINGNTAVSEAQTTLAEVFSGRGYDTGAFIAAFVLDGRWGLNQGFKHYDDSFDLKKYKQLDLGGVQKPGNEILDEALTWLEQEKDRPFFAWIHLYDPHTPYEPPEPFRSEYGGQGKGPAGLYDGEIAFMDSQIGRLSEWLAANRLDRKTVILLIGDHGEGLGSHGEGAHGYFIYDYAVHVPFIVVTPFRDLQGVRVASQSRTADVFPTVLELAGIPLPGKVNGHSQVPAMLGSKGVLQFPAYSESMAPNLQFGWSPLHSLRTPAFKFIDAPRPELYDLVADPGEGRDVQNRLPDRALAMKKELDGLMAETSAGAPIPQAANLDKETVERLAALGYVGAPVPAKTAAAKGQATLADPKDKLPVFQAVTSAGEMIMHEEYPKAVELLEQALKEEPYIPQALLLLATGYMELGNNAGAKAKLDQLLKEDPDSVQALISLTNLLMREGKPEDAIALGKRTLAVDDKNNQACSLIGEAYIKLKEHEKALPYLEKAVAIQPKLTQNRLALAACLVGMKRYGEAEPMFRDILVEAPKFPFVHFDLGVMYEEQGRIEEAKTSYSEEIAYFPKSHIARFNYGKLLYKLGDREGYMEQMRKVMEIVPEQPEGYLFVARGLLAESGPLDEIEGLVEKGLSLAKASEFRALGWFLMADIYNRRHEPDKMSEALQKANSYKTQDN